MLKRTKKTARQRKIEFPKLLAQNKSDAEIAIAFEISMNAAKKLRHRYNQKIFGANTSTLGGSGKRWGWLPHKQNGPK
jgi:hypothetical protein